MKTRNYSGRLYTLSTLAVTILLSGAMMNAMPAEAQVDSANTTKPPVAAIPAVVSDDDKLTKPVPADNGKVQYFSGGVGERSMKAIDVDDENYNLKLLFVAKGEYLANVSVTISNSKDSNILTVTTKGPVLLVKMHSGKYVVNTITAGGDKLSRRVNISSDHLVSYVMRYPQNEKN